LNQVRVGGLEARAHDETFPHVLGMPGEETIGPGGFANALRTIPSVIESLQIISEVAPEATVLNLTNPAGIVQHAATRYTHTRFISLCDSPITLGNDIATLLDVPREQIEIDYLGMNHLGWITGVYDREQDLMERLLERIDRLTYADIDVAYIRATRAIPIPYVRYYLHPERILAQQQGKMPRARQLQSLEQELLAAFEQTASKQCNPSSVPGRRGAVWYSAIVVPVLDALIHDRNTIWIVNVTNSQHIPWLPPETVIEVPARINRLGAHPLPLAVDALSEDLRTILYSQAVYEALAVPAIVEHNHTQALLALVAHPMIRSLDQAERVLDAVWSSEGVKS
jgi:6-phospho-beta-glucosidase